MENLELDSIEKKVLKSIENFEKNKDLNCFVRFYQKEAIERALYLDKKNEKKKLHGITVGLKDVFSYKDHPLQAASKILEGYEAKYNATVVERILNEDAIILGHQNCDEFGMGSSNENSIYGPCKNFINKEYSSGGSSGGGAVSVQAKISQISIATDTGGSTRQPAAFCGVIGFKPTYSRISRYGVVAYASSLDCVGIIGQDIKKIAKVLEIISGEDKKDHTCSKKAVEDYNNFENFSKKKYKIGYIKESLDFENLQKEIRDRTLSKLEILKKNGDEVSVINFKLLKYSLPTYYTIANCEASSNLACYDGVRYGYRTKNYENLQQMYERTRSEGFGEEAKKRILGGNYILSDGKTLEKAQKIRRLICEEFDMFFKDYDFIILPTTPSTAFKIGEIQDEMLMYMQDYFTVPFSLAGLPCISIPNGFDEKGLPIGLQIVSAPFSDKKLLNFSKYLLEL